MLILIGAIALSAPSGDVRYEVIDQADRYYQAQFANDELTKEGVFGTSRIESSKIKGHSRTGGDPSYRRRDVASEIFIYGNQGARLNVKSIHVRYRRSRNPGKGPHTKPENLSLDALVREAAKKSLLGTAGPFTKEVNGWVLQVRRVNLSKPVCLPCHRGLQQGDPVALIAFMARKTG